MCKLKKIFALLLVISILLGTVGCSAAEQKDSRDWVNSSTEELMRAGVIPKNIDTMTFGELLTYKAEKCPEVVIASEAGFALTWAQMDLAVKNMIQRLRAEGVEQGDVVGLYGRNSMNWMISFYALQAMGTVTHLLNYGIDEDTMIPLIAKYNIDYLVMGSVDEWDTKPDYAEILKKNTSVKGILDIRETNALIENLKPCPEVAYVDHDADAESVVMYTSSYKGIDWISCMTHTPADFMKIGVLEAQAIEMTPEDRELVVAAMFHMLGFTYGLVAANIYDAEAFLVQEDCRVIRPQTIREQAVQNGITVIPAIANTMIRLIYNEAFTEETAEALAGIRSIAVAGSAIYPEQIDRLYQCFPKATLTVLYGQTECAPISFTTDTDDYEHITHTLGKISPLVEAKVTEEGELIAKSEFQMKRLYMQPEETVFDEEGWLHTKDVVTIDEDGYLHSLGRLSERVTVDGESFFVTEITRYLVKSPDYADAYSCVVQVDGKSMIGTCVIMNGKEFREEEVRAYLKTGLSENRMPDVIVSYDELPQMPNGKIFPADLISEMTQKLEQKSLD